MTRSGWSHFGCKIPSLLAFHEASSCNFRPLTNPMWSVFVPGISGPGAILSPIQRAHPVEGSFSFADSQAIEDVARRLRPGFRCPRAAPRNPSAQTAGRVRQLDLQQRFARALTAATSARKARWRMKRKRFAGSSHRRAGGRVAANKWKRRSGDSEGYVGADRRLIREVISGGGATRMRSAEISALIGLLRVLFAPGQAIVYNPLHHTERFRVL